MTSDLSTSGTEIRKKQVIHSQARQLARTVLENCELERKNNSYKYPVNRSLDRAVYYTGLSKRTLSRIKSESKLAGPNEKLKSPKKRKKTGLKICVDNFDRSVVHHTITEFYLQKKIVPTCPKLLVALREKIDFPWGIRTLQRLLKKIGYKWCKSQNKHTLLVEKPDIVFDRYHYLKKIKEYRQQKRNILYVDESWFDNNLTFKKCWLTTGNKGILTEPTSGNRLVIVNAGGKNGFLPEASLIFKSGSTTGDYQGQMNSENFEKWVKQKLLPCLPPQSVIVMDNAPYHSVHQNKPPPKSSSKSEMINWLIENGINCDRFMRKAELFQIIEKHNPVDTGCKIENIIKVHGHDVLRLPPHMCDLNPVELAWTAIKRFVRENNVGADLSFTELRDVATNVISTVATETWEIFEEHVQKLEEKYWENDAQMESEMEDYVIELAETSDENDSSSDCGDVSTSDSDDV